MTESPDAAPEPSDAELRMYALDKALMKNGTAQPVGAVIVDAETFYRFLSGGE